ncbi:probable low-specificity L-threonine aldolase 2 [Octopus sinensis]|uniref:Probable low-specificity L-threonine aldolase 2 n=1 Tax=Octopus sinensis TaxID=2607531 RepID=A0A6P7TDY4_9MOLL|nr:probable low-specificity L-threonine aldolase 2 [Octopus sinensis]XP_036368105.1 probable low-specificity L-threonine aldolase 2 [Octopus sinensis]
MAPKFVDLSSDSTTKPSQAMREAMANAESGNDPMVSALETKCAELLGKEKALFIPTATMGNLMSIMSHCQKRGLEIIIGDKSHICLSEHGHVAQLAGVFPRIVPTLKDGTYDLTTLAETISTSVANDICRTKVICLENTHNRCGGKILPLDYLQKLYNLAQENNIKVHVDGARIWNAAVGLGVPIPEITKSCDSITVCLNKGIGAPFGAVVAGTESFIKRATLCRAALGGDVFKLGIEAAAALCGLERPEGNIQKDHILAKRLVNGLKNLSSSVVTIEPEEVQTNLILIKINKEMSFITNLKERLMMTTEAEVKELGKEIRVGCKLLGKDIRFAICCNINEEDIDDAIKKVCYVFNEIHF